MSSNFRTKHKIGKIITDYKLEKILRSKIYNASQEIVELTNRHGGCTYHFKRGNIAGQIGYAVSCHKQHETVLDSSIMPLSHELVQMYYAFHRDLLIPKKYSKQSYCLGTWHDAKSNKIYLDVVRVVADKVDALALAKKHNQLAIFDLKRLKEIFVK